MMQEQHSSASGALRGELIKTTIRAASITGVRSPESVVASSSITNFSMQGAMFHDMGLTPAYSSAHERFEVDGANAARDFLSSHGIGQDDIDTVWTAIALHTTPGIPQDADAKTMLGTRRERWMQDDRTNRYR
jgi:hypothetical protein